MSTPTRSERKYDYKHIEAKWQERWEKERLFHAPALPQHDNKFYMLVMFAYPSGDIHMGHFRNYIIGDAVARRQMMLGKAVLHPFGWDAFGLPAERAAIQRNIHPSEWTDKNIEVSRSTLQKVGISFDWSREVITCSPDYYKWTQWMFVQLFKHGKAFRKRGVVNWCPEDKTVLANEQVKEGRCERCGTLVEKKDQMGWYFRITDYADRLIDDLDSLPGWPDNVKTMQKEWIGRSYGLEVDFQIEGTGERLAIFTTRPDTIFGVTFMAISPEAEILGKLSVAPEFATKVREYQKQAASRSDIERAAATLEKDGVFTGQYAVTVRAIGYKPTGQRVQLAIGQRARLEFDMEKGVSELAAQTIIGEKVKQVEVQRLSVSAPVMRAEIENLPLNARGLMNLAGVAPGIKTYSPQSGRTLPWAGGAPPLPGVNVFVAGGEL